VFTTGPAIAILKLLVAVVGVEDESVTRTVKFEVPAVVGVPVILPVEAFRAKPPGSAPVAIDQVCGWVPPLAINVAA
jgi:hypothetical protein